MSLQGWLVRALIARAAAVPWATWILVLVLAMGNAMVQASGAAQPVPSEVPTPSKAPVPTTVLIEVERDLQAVGVRQTGGFYYDGDGTLPVSQIAALPDAAWRLGSTGQEQAFPGTLWFRLDLELTEPHAMEINLFYSGSPIEQFMLFYQRSTFAGGHEDSAKNWQSPVLASVSGSKLSWTNWSGRHSGGRLVLLPNTPTRLLIRMQSDFSLAPELILASDKGRAAFEQPRIMLFGLYFGCLIALALVSLAMYFNARRRLHLSFALYAFCSMANMIVALGYWDVIVRDLNLDPIFGGRSALCLMMAMTCVAAIAFTQDFLRTSEVIPRVHRLIAVMAVGMASVMFLGWMPGLQSFALGFLQISIGTVSLGSVALAAFCYRKGQTTALKFLAGWLPFIVSVVVWMLNENSTLPRTFWTAHAVPMGQIVQVIMFGFALVDDLRQHEAIKKKANESEELSLLLRTVTHDIATPLAVMTATAQRLLRNHPEIASLNRILRAAETVGGVVENVRNLLAYRDGKLSPMIESTLLRVPVTRALDLLSDKIKDKGITVKCDENSLDVHVSVDPRVFEVQILLNILTNAIKFSRPGETITVAARATDTQCELEIRDSGIGIPKPILSNLFDPAARTSRTGTGGEKGTGFGMPIVAAFIAAQGGSLAIDSICETEATECRPSGTTVLLRMQRAPLSTGSQAA